MTWTVLYAGASESIPTRWFETGEVNRIAAAKKAERELAGKRLFSMRRGNGPWLPVQF